MKGFSTENLNVGDEVIIDCFYYNRHDYEVGQITKKTPKGLIDVTVKNRGTKRFLQDGREYGRGDSWGCQTSTEYATPERIAEIKAAAERRKMIRRIKSAEWETFSNEALAKILGFLNEETRKHSIESEG